MENLTDHNQDPVTSRRRRWRLPPLVLSVVIVVGALAIIVFRPSGDQPAATSKAPTTTSTTGTPKPATLDPAGYQQSRPACDHPVQARLLDLLAVGPTRPPRSTSSGFSGTVHPPRRHLQGSGDQ
ncbi:hypothetical protein BC739_000742 [Kutzneria viridogrisea]|uniref:Uncharacterized protein n=1 Tax=Kutzneria viridogrisea TaxID=47990 RepID=A0ABR6B9K0_9PSEU|nr:hypothetical protein [Kutzneria viridogrisea]